MKQTLIFFLLFVVSCSCLAQTGDMIVIKKNGQGIKTFIKGLHSTFQTTSGNWISAYIYEIKNDSIFYREVIVRAVPTRWGVSRLDTMATIKNGLHYRDIAAIPKKPASFSFIRNGTMFMMGGAGYAALNLANSAIVGYPAFSKQNIPQLVAATGIFGVGMLMHKTHSNVIKVGKKYSLHYIKLK